MSGNRRIDRIREASYLDGLDALSLEELRSRRDECLGEREQLSLLRRMIQGRAEILKSELDSRGDGQGAGPLLDRLGAILAGDDSRATGSRGEALRMGVPEMSSQTRRSAERLVGDAAISDPSALGDAELADAVERLIAEEEQVSGARAAVIVVLDTLQDELKRRYKEDPSQALR